MEWTVKEIVNDWELIAPKVAAPVYFRAEGDVEGHWVKMHLEVDGGSVVVSKLEIGGLHPRPDGDPMLIQFPPPVTGEALRKIPVGYLAKEATRQVMADDQGDPEMATGPIPADLLSEWPNGDVDPLLRWVVSVYRRAAAIGDPPYPAIQKATGWSRATAGRALKKARDKGHLVPDERGWSSFGGASPGIKIEHGEAGSDG